MDKRLHKKWSFPFKISSVNVTKSTGILKKILNGRLHFLCSERKGNVTEWFTISFLQYFVPLNLPTILGEKHFESFQDR